MEDYQARVIVERDELSDRLLKLESFLVTGHADPAEYGRLMLQRDLMRALLRVLRSRVLNFAPVSA